MRTFWHDTVGLFADVLNQSRLSAVRLSPSYRTPLLRLLLQTTRAVMSSVIRTGTAMKGPRI